MAQRCSDEPVWLYRLDLLSRAATSLQLHLDAIVLV